MIDASGASTLGRCDECGWQTLEAGPGHRERASNALTRHRRAHWNGRRDYSGGNDLHRRIVAHLEQHPTATLDDLADALDEDRDAVAWQLGYVARTRPDLPLPYLGSRPDAVKP